MTSAEDPARVQAIARFLMPLSSHDVTLILEMVKSRDAIPGGWKDAPDRIKLINIQKILVNLSDETLALLEQLIFEDEPTLINVLGEYFATLSEQAADDALRLVSSGHITPSGWGRASDIVKTITARNIFMGMADEEIELLAEYLPDDERTRLLEMPISVHGPAPEPARPSELATSVHGPAPEPVRLTELATFVPEATTKVGPMLDGPIFVVHGHARAVLHEAVRVLERGTSKEVIVLHEQANAGRTILEKFEDYAADVSFAAVLLTGDDEGSIRTSSEIHLRGRQNVIFELGFFFGKLGRQRVVVLLEENVERPSDIAGLVYITLDQSGAWKYHLARELEAAGISVDRAQGS
jgi:predicted nucleotide-binding protein